MSDAKPTTWGKKLAAGIALLGAAFGLHATHTGPGWLPPALEAIGGILVVFASCELMILCVEGIARRLRWNDFVAGSIAGLASNLPEVVMLGFIIAAAPRAFRRCSFCGRQYRTTAKSAGSKQRPCSASSG